LRHPIVTSQWPRGGTPMLEGIESLGAWRRGISVHGGCRHRYVTGRLPLRGLAIDVRCSLASCCGNLATRRRDPNPVMPNVGEGFDGELGHHPPRCADLRQPPCATLALRRKARSRTESRSTVGQIIHPTHAPWMPDSLMAHGCLPANSPFAPLQGRTPCPAIWPRTPP
jgi:hypothetical protein